MKKLILVVMLVLAFACTSAFAFVPVSNNLTNTRDSSIVNVMTTANFSGGIWTWIYEVTPDAGSTDVSIFRINLGQTITSSIFNVNGPVNTAGITTVPCWSNYGLNNGYIQWTDKLSNNNLTAGNTYRFGFDTKYGPQSEAFASAMAADGYTGYVPGPSTVPEPGSLLALTSFLAASAGFMRIRKN